MKTSVSISFGERVSNLRKKSGQSQEEFAFACGINRTYIGEIERGEKNISLDYIAKIAKGLNMTLKELFNYD